MLPSLQGVFLGGSLLRVSEESPGPPGVSVESPGVPESPGSVSGDTPKSPRVSEESPGKSGYSLESPSVPGVSQKSFLHKG